MSNSGLDRKVVKMPSEEAFSELVGQDFLLIAGKVKKIFLEEKNEGRHYFFAIFCRGKDFRTYESIFNSSDRPVRRIDFNDHRIYAYIFPNKITVEVLKNYS